MTNEELKAKFQAMNITEKVVVGILGELVAAYKLGKTDIPFNRVSDLLSAAATTRAYRAMQAGLLNTMKVSTETKESVELTLMAMEMSLDNHARRSDDLLINLREGLMKDFPNADRK